MQITLFLSYNFSPREELQHGKNKAIKEKTKTDK